MARPKKSESQRTSEELLTAAEREFGRKGFDAARLSDIAEAAGISRPSLLYRYSSKEVLYEAVVRAAFLELAERLRLALTHPESPGRAVEYVVAEFQLFLSKRPSLPRLLVRELIAGDGPGRGVLVESIVPLLDLVELGLTRAGRPGTGMREMIVTLAASILLRSASGEIAEKLWGTGDGTETMAIRLILGEAGEIGRKT